MNRDYTSEEIIGLIEGVCVAIEEHGWLRHFGAQESRGQGT